MTSVETIHDSGRELVACPTCEKKRAVRPGVYVCARCSTEFRVSRDDAEEVENR